MAEFSIHSNAPSLAADFARIGAAAGPALGAVTKAQGRLLLAEIKKNASGRPGPRTITGDYRRSWTGTVVGTPFGGGFLAYTESPQAKRLEYGFWNKTDSLGRRFRQPAYRHVGPAVLKYDALFPLAVDRTLIALLNRKAQLLAEADAAK